MAHPHAPADFLKCVQWKQFKAAIVVVAVVVGDSAVLIFVRVVERVLGVTDALHEPE